MYPLSVSAAKVRMHPRKLGFSSRFMYECNCHRTSFSLNAILLVSLADSFELDDTKHNYQIAFLP